MRSSLFAILAFAGATFAQVNNDHLKTDVVLAKTCNRKSEKGDTINVHYSGTLQSDGSKFDASYDRGTPFSFKLGGGQVSFC